MADFPAPKRRDTSAYRSAEPAPLDAEPAKSPVVISRAEPPREDVAPARGAKPMAGLSKDEIAALLAVEGTNRAKKWGEVGHRAKIVAIPTGILSTLLGALLGTWAALAIIGASIAYTAWPLVQQKKSGWV